MKFLCNFTKKIIYRFDVFLKYSQKPPNNRKDCTFTRKPWKLCYVYSIFLAFQLLENVFFVWDVFYTVYFWNTVKSQITCTFTGVLWYISGAPAQILKGY